MILKARFVVTGEGSIIEDGCVVCKGDRISWVGRATDAAWDSCTSIDYGDAVIAPGFVNAHTHLELTHLHGRVPPGPDFVAWLHQLMEVLRSSEDAKADAQSAVLRGIEESLKSGVSLVADITRQPTATRPVLGRSPLRAVSFGEVVAIGKRRDLLSVRLDAASRVADQTERMRIGLSPHAPYTVEPEALEACARRARTESLHLCIHAAETKDEQRFTNAAAGPFAEYLKAIGVWDKAIPASGCGPIELIQRTGLLTRHTLLAHANYVSDDELAIIAAGGASVVYCPRTHNAFGHDPHRFRDMTRAGINICIGTDSLASNPSLSILDELRFLHRRHREFDPVELLRMGTINGAKALGYGAITGTLTVAKAADIVVIPLPFGEAASDWSAILASDEPPVALYIGGKNALASDA